MNQPVYVAPHRKRIPYGMMNFADIRRDNYYYVDKTHFIPQIEEADRFFFFIRPRRFGKSLTLSVLQHYYDIRMRDEFNVFFSDLYIGQHPTPDRNSYLVLKLNFSGMTHSYIVELKYAKYKDPEGRVEELRQEAIAQANRYAESETVKQAVGSTQLHKVVVVYKGMEMRVCEEVSLTNIIRR